MNIKTWILSCGATAALSLSACVMIDMGPEDEDGTGSDAGSSSTGDAGVDPQGGPVCSASKPCPSGQYCWNGLCVNGCLSNGDCADDQYCSIDEFIGHGVCVNKEVPTCSGDADCDTGQQCLSGVCSTRDTSVDRCTPRLDGQDGCDPFSICLAEDEEGEQTSCYAFPPCPEDGVCPVGQLGAVCNEGDIPQKARICLTSLCKDDSHCPARFSCVLGSGSLGFCSDGSWGSPCQIAGDCAQGLSCNVMLPGQPGMCVDGSMSGDDCASLGGTCVDMFDGCPDDTSVDVEGQCASFSDTCCVP